MTYRLKLPTTWKIHNVFQATLLKPYTKNKVHGNNFPRPPPDLIEGEEVYEVDSILKHRRRGRGYQFYVKWKGYPISEAMWESESAFSDDGDTLSQYKQVTSCDRHYNMPSMRLSKSTPDLRKQPSSFLRLTAEENDQKYIQLEKMIEGWEKEYDFMDHPIKLKQEPRPTIPSQRPPSNTPTIDKILLSLFSDN